MSKEIREVITDPPDEGNPDHTPEITVYLVDPFAGREDLVFCEGKGPDDPSCLEKNPPEGKQMINGHMCGAGCTKFGTCKAVFADPKKHPDLFESFP